MSDIKQITAVARDRAGKGAARAVRRQGQVPAVIYGGGEAAEAIALDFNQTRQLIFAGHFLIRKDRCVPGFPISVSADPSREPVPLSCQMITPPQETCCGLTRQT